MTFEAFQKFIPRAAQKYGVKTEVEAAHVCQIFRNIVPGIFAGMPTPEKFITPAYVKNKQLVVNVETPAWGQEVITRKHKIIEEMNKKAGKEIIKNLKAQLIR